MTEYTVRVIIDDRAAKPARRRVAVGILGPGIATIVCVESMPESVRPAAPVRTLEASNA